MTTLRKQESAPFIHSTSEAAPQNPRLCKNDNVLRQSIIECIATDCKNISSSKHLNTDSTAIHETSTDNGQPKQPIWEGLLLSRDQLVEINLQQRKRQLFLGGLYKIKEPCLMFKLISAWMWGAGDATSKRSAILYLASASIELHKSP